MEVADRFGLYSAKRIRIGPDSDQTEIIPDARGNILAFPFIERDQEVNTKYRAPGKKFTQRKGGAKTFFNSDIIDAPELQDGRQALVITEGEIDCISAVQCGYPWTVSCPDGAPADKDNLGRPIPMRPEAEIDPQTDAKFAFVFRNWERLKKIKRIILATDGDGPGERLRDELARRLGKIRCLFVAYPPEPVVPQEGGKPRPCKDLNEVLMHLGPARVIDVLHRAKPIPVSGLYTVDDFEPRGALATFSTGFPELDPFFKVYRGMFGVLSGLPYSGKSALANQIAFNLAVRYGWKTAFGTFEVPVRPQLVDQLTGFYTERPKSTWTDRDRAEALDFIREHFVFITSPPRGSKDPESLRTVDWYCEKAMDAVLRFGVQMTVLDPWNELEHRRLPGEMRDEYTGRALGLIKGVAQEADVSVLCVAHPTKEAGQHEEAMTLYGISDGAMWSNKAEQGVIVTKKGEPNAVGRSTSEVSVRKVKFAPETGRLGSVMMTFDVPSRQFIPWRESSDEREVTERLLA